jgi:hypothetical protein
VVLEENIRLLDLSTGFRILPRLQNDQVSLDIAARHDTGPTPSQNNREQILTTLDTTTGQWVELGGTRTGLPADNNRQYSTRPKEPQTTRVFIRIDLPPR